MIDLLDDLLLNSGEFGMEEVYIPTETLGKTEVEALDESEKLVEKYMEYAAKETKVNAIIVQQDIYIFPD